MIGQGAYLWVDKCSKVGGSFFKHEWNKKKSHKKL